MSSLLSTRKLHGDNLSFSPGRLLVKPVAAGWGIGQGVGREDGQSTQSGWAGVRGERPGRAVLGLKVPNFAR